MKRLIRYMQDLVLGARGNVASFTLRQAKRALGVESKAEEVALRAALEALASLGLLQKASGRKPRYLLQRGTPLWSALERGCADLLDALAGRCPQPDGEGQPNARPGGPASRRDGGMPTPDSAGAPSQEENASKPTASAYRRHRRREKKSGFQHRTKESVFRNNWEC